MIYKTGKIKLEKPPIAVDFDGVIHSYSKGFNDGSIYDGLVPGVREAMAKLKEKFYIYISSARSDSKEGKEAIEEYLRINKIPFDEVSLTKPPAKIYIDDRAIRFKNWEQTLEDVDNFDREIF